MRKASNRGFSFTAIAILVCVMALSAFYSKAESAVFVEKTCFGSLVNAFDDERGCHISLEHFSAKVHK